MAYLAGNMHLPHAPLRRGDMEPDGIQGDIHRCMVPDSGEPLAALAQARELLESSSRHYR
jgi:hypothetical protein